MKKILIIIFLLSLSFIKLFCQESSWSLRDCMMYAIENSTKAKIQATTNDDKKIDNREAYLNWIPTISGSSSAYSNFGHYIDPETNLYTNTGSFSNSYSVSASYTIFDGFAVVNNYRISKIAMLSGVQEYQQVKDNLCLQIVQAYYNVLYSIEMVKITKEQLDESLKSIKRTKVMEEMGMKGQADLLMVEAQAATNDYNFVKEENTLSQAILTLKTLMSYPLGESLNIDTNIVRIIDPFFEKESPDSILNSAKSYLPSLMIADYNLSMAKLNYQTAKYRILPNVYASGGVSSGFVTALGSTSSTASPFSQQMKDRLNEQVGIGISIPIFTSLGRWNKKSKMKNAMLRAQYQKDQTLQEVESEIQKAYQEMEGAAKQYVQAEKRAKATELAYRASVKKYDEGLISVIELQTSSNQLLISKAEKMNTMFTYLLKSKIVEYYKGIPYLDQE